MSVVRCFAAAIVVGTVSWQAAAAQTTGTAPLGASVAPPPAPAVEEIVIDPTATISLPADPTQVRKVRPARTPRPKVASRVVEEEEAIVTLTLGPPVLSTTLPDDTRVIPLHVARKRARIGSFRVPPGYRPAWEDDRLNPLRAVGTLGGRAAMNDVWTTTVPRRLIDATARPARKAEPVLVYPILSSRPVSGAFVTGPADRSGPGRAHGAGVGR